MSIPYSEIQRLDPSAQVWMFMVDATDIPMVGGGYGSVYHFCPTVNENGASVVWQGTTYDPLPCKFDGFEWSSKNTLPRPKIQVSALDGVLGALVRDLDDLVGAKLTLKRTFARYLDVENFAATTITDEPLYPTIVTGSSAKASLNSTALNAATSYSSPGGIFATLSVNGVPVSATNPAPTVTSIYRTDWQSSPRTNLAVYSSQIDNAAWQKTGAGVALAPVVTANYGEAPDGTITADRVVMSLNGGTTSTDQCRLDGSYTFTPTGPYTFSCWLKTSDGTTKTIGLRVYNSSGNTYTVITPTWQRVSFTFNPAGPLASSFGLVLRGPYTDQTADLLMWGAQLEYGTSATSYIPTTNVAVTVYDTPTLLSTSSRTNVWLQSQALTTSPNTTDGNGVMTANVIVAPDGTNTGCLLAEQSVTSWFRVWQGSTLTAQQYTLSVFAKPNGRNWLYLYADIGYHVAYVDILNKVVGTQVGAHTITFQSCADGWVKVSMTFTNTTLTAQNCQVWLARDGSTNNYLGTAGTGVYLWGIELKPGGPSPYIPTTTTPKSVTDYSVSGNVVTFGESPSGTYTWSGTANAHSTADPTACWPDEPWIIERKSLETKDVLEFELVTPLDMQNAMIPRRRVMANVCQWNDASVCTYSTGNQCGKKLSDCRKHWQTSTGPITIVTDALTDYYTRSSGSYIADGFSIGDGVMIINFANQDNNGHGTILNLSATAMRVTVLNESGFAVGKHLVDETCTNAVITKNNASQTLPFGAFPGTSKVR